ncbi:mRNA-capping enzyme-like [Anaeramoeba flamelloides]|uniref:mRNA-capping enzyme-like n=1 Tax=Anaeramoeba flamelloides TaxID=1746091 RepID=A0AAV7YTH0_9EUKA|nr:mRNA-capping enzyme-like [Anaeramoeba flamelloides]
MTELNPKKRKRTNNNRKKTTTINNAPINQNLHQEQTNLNNNYKQQTNTKKIEKEKEKEKQKESTNRKRKISTLQNHSKIKDLLKQDLEKIDLEIPKYWEDVPRMGGVIEGTNFIPIKTPLDQKFSKVIKLENQFTPSMFLDFQKSLKRKVGLIIDLTNTTRYYDKTFFTENNIQYKKIPCTTNGNVPQRLLVDLFSYTVKKFIEENPTDYIVCHCKYGYNVTGYMIVNFMVSVLRQDILKSINRFKVAREPGIYKLYYFEALFEQLFDASIPNTLKLPELPTWKKTKLSKKNDQSIQQNEKNKKNKIKKDQNIQNINQQNNTNLQQTVNQNQNVKIKKKKFSKNIIRIIGEKVASLTEEDKLKTFICNWFSWNDKSRFPATIPVSLTKLNSRVLKQQHYYVTWNSIGERCMLLILAGSCFLINKHFQFYKINIRFPKIDQTLVDGEIVMEKIPNKNEDKNDNNENESGNENKGSNTIIKYVFLISDAMFYNGKSYYQKKLGERLGVVKHLINVQKNQLSKKELEREPVQIRFKDMYELKHAKTILNILQQQFHYKINGLIFYPVNQPYTLDLSSTTLKWKFPKFTKFTFSIRDFVGSDRKKAGAFLLSNSLIKRVNEITFSDLYEKIRYLDKLVDCEYDIKSQKWKAISINQNQSKKKPDTIEKYESMMKKIGNTFDQYQLLAFIEEILRNNSNK